MQLPEPFHARGEHFAIDLPGATAIFTTRRGGHSRGPYASLNLGRMTDDDPAAVERNRAQVRELAHGAPLAFVRQVHGASVVAAGDGVPEADGLVTDRPGLALAVLTADCLPIAVAAPGAVGMLHAGWRGLAAGVVEAGVQAVRSAAVPGASLTAAIGPGAGPCCYEVGPEVLAAFGGEPVAQAGRRRLNLAAIAAERLRAAGVTEVHDIGLCTICSEPGLLFSHRRDRGVTGRQAGVAWLS